MIEVPIGADGAGRRPAPTPVSQGTIWFTGLSGSGKSTVASTLKAILDDQGLRTFLLDGDLLREGLNSDLGFEEADRVENVRRVGEVALLFAGVGYLSLVTVISPYSKGRAAVRNRHATTGIPFVEVHVATPLEVCEQRDTKGLYARARRGEVRSFTGISAPYEPPESPELVLSTLGKSKEESALEVLAVLQSTGLLPAGAG